LKGGEANISYDVAGNSRKGTATVRNDSTSLSASYLDWLGQVGDHGGNADYVGNLTPQNALGLTIGRNDNPGRPVEFKSQLEGYVLSFSPYLNYTANDRGRYNSGYDRLEMRMGKVAMTQAFELGNSIAIITGMRPGHNLEDMKTEPGRVLARCMTNKLKGGKK